jgi:hypothetical protein
LLCLPAIATAQSREPGNAVLTAEHRTELINDVSEVLTDVYVFPDVAATMVKLINDKNKAGDYEQFETVSDFTGQITEDLQSISHDRHLHVSASEAPLRNDTGEQLTGEQMAERRLAEAKAGNFGFKRLELLPGNIGYIDLRGFISAEIGGPTAVAAMNFLANSSALIFDLRRNGGGDPSMIQLLSSYLFAESEHLNSFYIRRSDSTEQFWTQASVQGPKMVDTPVYILTSRGTFSAAEEFTYNLKNMERATVVGETTGGGAHPVEFVSSDMGGGHYARISIPFGRAINPITGTNWEGTGIAPHIETQAADALAVAQLDILDKLAESAGTENQKFEIEWARDELDFNLNPPAANTAGAAFYTGTYGPRKITLEDGKLFYQRGEGRRIQLHPMKTADRFHVGELDYFRLQFHRDESGKVVELSGLYNSGRVDTNRRSEG